MMLNAAGGIEWAVVLLTVGTVIACLCLVIRAQGGMLIRTQPNVLNDYRQAADLMVKLVSQTKDSIVIHDNAEVVDAFRRRIARCDIKVRCLSNDRDSLRLLTLLDEAPDNIDIMYADERPPNDIHYKIVDGGKYVHLSRHEHGASERHYTPHTAKWATKAARGRVAQAYLARISHHAARARPQPHGSPR